MTTYPNQKVVHINKPNYDGDYLTVGNSEWIEASNNLKPITFKIYLYLAGNANGFDLALSRQDIMNKLKVCKDSYIKSVKELEEKGYLKEKQGNIYDFYTKPMYDCNSTLNEPMYDYSSTVCMTPVVHDVLPQSYSMYDSSHTEINKINNINNINKVASLHAANAEENKWTPDDCESRKIFGSPVHTDKRMIEIIRDEYADNLNKTPKEIANAPCFWGANTEAIIEYINDVFMAS